MSHIQRPHFDPGFAPFTLALPPHVHPTLLRGWQAGTKRGFDIVLALLLLVGLALPMTAIAAWIRLDSRGPILFRQPRIGRYGQSFRVLKFRTMRCVAAAPSGPSGPCRQATRDDPRVTRAGNVLRRFSIDEWPQLLNVLRGEMSLVGPRPHAPGTCAGGRPFEQITARYAARHQVRPGITGLAQVRGWRGETETEEKLHRRVESDLEYIETWSLGLDIGILLRTIPAVLHATNAY
jgi:lipopolysaccharide/colanic/teichoic acid biosynthesis glycosyltransferase